MYVIVGIVPFICYHYHIVEVICVIVIVGYSNQLNREKRQNFNIFFLNDDPIIAARNHCDQHIIKMILEYAQMLCTAHNHYNGSDIPGLYKSALIYHPCTKWVYASADNYAWLQYCWWELVSEWKIRWKHLEDGKKHHSESMYNTLCTCPSGIPWIGLTPYPIAMNNRSCIIEGDIIASYRNYYRVDKRRFATWKNGRTPEWWY